MTKSIHLSLQILQGVGCNRVKEFHTHLFKTVVRDSQITKQAVFISSSQKHSRHLRNVGHTVLGNMGGLRTSCEKKGRKLTCTWVQRDIRAAVKPQGRGSRKNRPGTRNQERGGYENYRRQEKKGKAAGKWNRDNYQIACIACVSMGFYVQRKSATFWVHEGLGKQKISEEWGGNLGKSFLLLPSLPPSTQLISNAPHFVQKNLQKCLLCRLSTKRLGSESDMGKK